MNRTKNLTTLSNITLEEYIIQTSANGWLLQISPVLKNFFKQLAEKITNSIDVISSKKFSSENEMMKGRVKFFNKTKRFGFISTEKEDIFVHISELKDRVRPNDEVIFEIENGQNGSNAVNVRLAN